MFNAVALMVITARFHGNIEDSRVQCRGTGGKAVRVHGYSAVARVHKGHSTHKYSEDSHVQCFGIVGECREVSRVQGACALIL